MTASEQHVSHTARPTGRPLSEAEVRARYPTDQYVAFHARRYAYLLGLLGELFTARPAERMLDIGPSWFPLLVNESFGIAVDTIGLDPDCPNHTGLNYHFDLNDAQYPERWRRDIPTYRVVVMAEVIEHLYTAPRLVLAFVRTLLEPGATLILQTPNALALHKRLKVALGRHPYEMIREDNHNPGHFREYTQREMRQLAEAAGFEVVSAHAAPYFDYRYTTRANAGSRRAARAGAVANAVYRIVPPAWQQAYTLVLRPS